MNNIEEKAIQATDIDAIEAKAYAVTLGYWKDPYIKLLNINSKCKAPEINRGYFARTKSIEIIVKEFLMHNKYAQIISLGAGSDTLYFRLIDQCITPHKFLELDLPENVLRKINQMSKKKLFHDKLGLDASNPFKVDSKICRDPYYLLPGDLRSNPEDLINHWRDTTGISLNNPTLFIAECVLVYIAPEIVDRFLETMAISFPNSAVLSYDPINMNDAFGKMMIQNLKMRHIELRGVLGCENKDAIVERYRRCKFIDTKIWSISEVYNAFSKETLRRISSIEMLDDPEMMTQLFDHYCLTLASVRVGLLARDDIVSLLDGVL